jgi:hypothetical protein
MGLLRIFKSNRELVRENLELKANLDKLQAELDQANELSKSAYTLVKKALANDIKYQKDIKWLNNCLRWFAIDVQDYKYGKEAIKRHEARAYARANSKNSNKETV